MSLQTIAESFWNDDLLTVVVLCCIDPQGVGCDLADVRQVDNMGKQVMPHYPLYLMIVGIG